MSVLNKKYLLFIGFNPSINPLKGRETYRDFADKNNFLRIYVGSIQNPMAVGLKQVD